MTASVSMERRYAHQHRSLFAKTCPFASSCCVFIEGGCDGCIDPTNPDNSGLEEAIEAISYITDKYEKYKVPYSTNEKHSPDEFDPKENGGLDNPENRHKDKLIDDICDTHPGSPMCKVFDC